MDWISDLLTTFTHHSELQAINSAIANLHDPSIFKPAVFTRRSLATVSNSGDSSASRAHVVPSPTLVQNCLPGIYSGTLNPILCCSRQLQTVSLLSLLNYSPNCQPRRLSQLSSTADSQLLLRELEIFYDWWFTANQFVLATSPLRLTTSNFIFQLNTCGYSPYIASSLSRG
jgi:hypothetical protein